MIRLFAFILCLSFSVFGFSSEFQKLLEPKDDYKKEILTVDYLPFHEGKSQVYLNQKNEVTWVYKYNDGIRDRYIAQKDNLMKANHSEQYGTIDNNFVLYDPKADHKQEIYWPIDAKLNDTWKGNLLYFKYDATLSEFGDITINGNKKKYVKIIIRDPITKKRGHIIFVKDLGMLEFSLDYLYLKLKTS